MSIQNRLIAMSTDSSVDALRREFPTADRRQRAALITAATGATKALAFLVLDAAPVDADADQILTAVRARLTENLALDSVELQATSSATEPPPLPTSLDDSRPAIDPIPSLPLRTASFIIPLDSNPIPAHLVPLPPDSDVESPERTAGKSGPMTVSFSDVDVTRPPPPPPYATVVPPSHRSVATAPALPHHPSHGAGNLGDGLAGASAASSNRSSPSSHPSGNRDERPSGSSSSAHLPPPGGPVSSHGSSVSTPAATGTLGGVGAGAASSAPAPTGTLAGAGTGAISAIPTNSSISISPAIHPVSTASVGTIHPAAAAAAGSFGGVGIGPSSAPAAMGAPANVMGATGGASPSSSPSPTFSPGFASSRHVPWGSSASQPHHGAVPRRGHGRGLPTAPDDPRTSLGPPGRSSTTPASPGPPILPPNVDLSDSNIRTAVDHVLRGVIGATTGRTDRPGRGEGSADRPHERPSERYRVNWSDFNPAKHASMRAFFDEIDEKFELTDFSPLQKVMHTRSLLTLDHSNFATSLLKIKPDLKHNYEAFRHELISKVDGSHPRKHVDAWVAMKQKQDVPVIAYATEVRTAFTLAHPAYPPDLIDLQLSHKFIDTLYHREIAEKLADHQFDLYADFDQLVIHAQNYEINLLRKKKQGSFFSSVETSAQPDPAISPPPPTSPNEAFRFEKVGISLDEGIDEIISTLTRIRPFGSTPRYSPRGISRGKPFNRPFANNPRGAPRGAWRPPPFTPPGRGGMNTGFIPPSRGMPRGRGRGRGVPPSRARGRGRGNPGPRGNFGGPTRGISRGRGAPGAPSTPTGPGALNNPNTARPVATPRRRAAVNPAPALPESRKRLVDYSSSEGVRKIARQNYDDQEDEYDFYQGALWEGYCSTDGRVNDYYDPNLMKYYDPQAQFVGDQTWYEYDYPYTENWDDNISPWAGASGDDYEDEYGGVWVDGYEGEQEDEGIAENDHPPDSAAS